MDNNSLLSNHTTEAFFLGVIISTILGPLLSSLFILSYSYYLIEKYDIIDFKALFHFIITKIIRFSGKMIITQNNPNGYIKLPPPFQRPIEELNTLAILCRQRLNENQN